jgi:NADH:ubiquinone oxidoreductase subunit 3 (subunit A)
MEINIVNFSTFFFNDSTSLLKTEYLSILIYLVVAVMLSVIILTFSYLLVVQNPETEKMSAYECGFEPYEDARHKFDVKFYLVAMLFIIFDIETMYLIPWSVSISKLNLLGFWSMMDFIIELGIGFIYVWYIGGLDWD